NTGWVVGFGGTISKTIDGGENWISQSSGTTKDLESVHFTDQNTGWAVGRNGTILKTIDGGTNWEGHSCGTGYDIHSIYFTNSNTGWIACGEHDGKNPQGEIWKTTNGGEDWVNQFAEIGSVFQSVHFIDTNTGWVVGWYGAILQTTNGGEDWVFQTSGTTKGLRSVHFTDQNTGWAVGRFGALLKTTNGGVTFVEEEEINNIPTNYNLNQNFPNPFNPSTKIKFSIPKTSKVTIKIYDILGNEIETLVNEEKPTGTYEITWNAENSPSGVYFYQLRTGEFVETKKMILIK
ncbi:MAG: YCF48-related protein, partial [Ignavibacteriaceae bacterium]|nr:YCF48-related protein [Ignavibacteriaceae bacterium]